MTLEQAAVPTRELGAGRVGRLAEVEQRAGRVGGAAHGLIGNDELAGL